MRKSQVKVGVFYASVAEQVDATDLKSVARKGRAGSIPATGTNCSVIFADQETCQRRKLRGYGCQSNEGSQVKSP